MQQLLLSAMILAVSSAASVAESAPAFAEPRDDVPGLPNFARVSDSLYRGAQPTEEGFRQLRAMGIRTVVSLRTFTSDRDELEGTGLRYVRLAAQAWYPEDEDTLRFLKIMSDPANHPVFVHCLHGADRTGCAVAVYRVVQQGWTMQDAIAEMHRFGFHRVWCMIGCYLEGLRTDRIAARVERTRMPKIDTP